MKILVLINSAAGSVTGSEGIADRVQAAFVRHGADATMRVIAGPEIEAAVQAFVAHKSEGALAVAGGDGTISAAAGVLAGTPVPFGILPLGTLNHFAKDLHLPLDLDGAAGVIAAGHTRQIDVAEVNGRVFVNNSSVGLYPFMVSRRNAYQRLRGVGKLLATLPALLQTLRGASWHRLEIAAAGQRLRVRTPCIFVGNNPYQIDLTAFGSRARLDTGELDIRVIRTQSRLGVLLLPFKIALGLVHAERDVQSFHCGDLEIVSRRLRPLRVSLDGEVVGMATPLRYRSRPAALRVLCPPIDAV